MGEQIEVMLQPSGMAGMVFRPTILSIKPDRELRWLGHLLVPGLFDGEHIFTIEPLGANRVRFIQYERFTGMQVVQLFNREERDAERHARVNRDYLEAHLRSITYYALFFPVIELFTSVALAPIIHRVYD